MHGSQQRYEIMRGIVDTLIKFVEDNEYAIKDKAKEGGGWFQRKVVSLLDIDDKAYEKIISTLEQVKDSRSKQDEILKYLDSFVGEKLALEHNQKAINEAIIGIIDSKTTALIFEAIIEKLESNKDELAKHIKNFLETAINELLKNHQKLEAINDFLANKIAKIIYDSRDTVANYIENIINSWDEKTITKELELEIGKDLQFIRINGLIIGAILGLLIYGINDFVGKFF